MTMNGYECQSQCCQQSISLEQLHCPANNPKICNHHFQFPHSLHLLGANYLYSLLSNLLIWDIFHFPCLPSTRLRLTPLTQHSVFKTSTLLHMLPFHCFSTPGNSSTARAYQESPIYQLIGISTDSFLLNAFQQKPLWKIKIPDTEMRRQHDKPSVNISRFPQYILLVPSAIWLDAVASTLSISRLSEAKPSLYYFTYELFIVHL